MSYTPHPLDTSHVTLREDILKLIEPLAENAHEIWAQRRLAEDWHYGPEQRSDIEETDLLVPYGKLPESEKEYEYDRDAVLQTLKGLIALGYRIEKT